MTDKLNIIEMVEKRDGFSTLTKALKQARLDEALKGKGPFTLFAPTDEAFAALPQGKLDDLLKPENREQLKSMLQYHVVRGKLVSKEIERPMTPQTMQGQALKADVTGGFKVNEARVVTPDLEATNGVVQVIDHVLMPQAAATAGSTAR